MQIGRIIGISNRELLCVLTFASATLMTSSSLQGIQGTNPTLSQATPTYVEAPLYPPLAYKARITGTVEVDLTVDLDGKVQSTRLVNGHPLLAGASEKAATLWRFERTQDTRTTRIVRVWLVYKLVQTDTEGEETISSFLPPNRIEIAKRLPGVVSYLPSRLGESKDFTCRIHRETMREDTVPIIYGLTNSDSAAFKARERLFPNANLSVSGGCLVESARFAKVLYCAKCRSAAADWKKRN
jgi:TonB family protein